MKNTMFFALMILAALPAAAQKAATSNCSVSAETMTALADEYAARVDGLLRDAHASLRSISERVDAGSMSPERAQKLKFEVTRDVISLLDAISAVYDVRLNKNGAIDNEKQAAAGNASAADKTTHATRHANGTISVEELKRETAAALLTSRPRRSPDDRE
ncbi:MAG: hypothetical protein WB799_15320 [Candidatus Sulfotelmatobacter sp.]